MTTHVRGTNLFPFVLSREHGLATGVAVSSWFVLQYMGVRVMKARKRFNIEYPKLYANELDTQSKTFNCIQRGHQNTLEAYPEFLLTLGLGSVRYPVVASIGGIIWLLGKVIFFEGYSTGHPKKRRYGFFSYLGLYIMMGCSLKSVYNLIRA